MSSAIEEEKEILESIYPDEFQCLDERTFQITQTIDSEESKCSDPPSVILIATLSDEYPNEIPEIKIRISPPHRWLGEEQMKYLQEVVHQNAEECLGMAMVFSLCSILKEEVNTVLYQQCEKEEKELEDRQNREIELENEKFQGTPVTAESFMKWKKEFDIWREEEIRRENEERLRNALNSTSNNNVRKAILEKKLTGRQLFERNMVKVDDSEDYD
ncbi:RWD domain protein, involved in cytoplasmic translation Gir2 [Schizosaccharomyces osmophilus]|uniref:RWD domain protein, involved in cytoplasmic translation Gir2 n=1 Tax=Schizosaccharomyces osmophilus TaxID=2545709 RepID=A0AAE9WKD1_9SCHI|nr:RWD domain protein, involved in cytoplasmic translation Gir2 [Schizosaccharomyces osmophilus]WBW75552.1 RWD domain protein, involved in cytoplasmic translation Gir2 [Schizosaccharomyces osmophilus]